MYFTAGLSKGIKSGYLQRSFSKSYYPVFVPDLIDGNFPERW